MRPALYEANTYNTSQLCIYPGTIPHRNLLRISNETPRPPSSVDIRKALHKHVHLAYLPENVHANSIPILSLA
jgi:hypothetical protein